jgi:spermidine dehydrogenase
MNGGTLEIDSPRPYSPVAAGLLKTLGLDVAKLIRPPSISSTTPTRVSKRSLYFDRETFGSDKFMVGTAKGRTRKRSRRRLYPSRRKQIVELETGRIDYLPGLSSDENKQRLSRLS